MVEGIKLIHATGQHDEPDDPSYPWKLEIICRAPEFMEVAFIGLYGGTERVIARGMTKEALENIVKLNGYDSHPRLISLRIYQPEAKEDD